jgi:hypothetical protein
VPLFFSDGLKMVKTGKLDIAALCIGCKSSEVEIVAEHPYFEGSLCEGCKVSNNICLLAVGKHQLYEE